ncbi:hypothetical protein PhCBS80983_g01296 [Powellomyces hirtus]|uniref:t-SNARE coiled-coil homology domain-containing protein n=1 Tax=Powellomyces hirtus TaxID=109895 RepID=A0A507EBL5_9FUNG|nr:hypothetical protein PhCBS80983_g01296 [Powellomyces hirtus]
MPSDLETGPLSPGGSTNPAWESERFTLEILGEDISTLILEKKHAVRTGVSVGDLDSRIRRNLQTFRDGIEKLEQSLSEAEESSGRGTSDLRRWEEAVLKLSQQYDRLELMARGEDGDHALARKQLLARSSSATTKGGKAVRFVEPLDDGDGSEDVGGALQLQQRIMDDQDTQLDELSATIGRQKQIGILINDELDLHVDLLEETEERVDSTHRRLQGAGRRLEQVLLSSARNSKGSSNHQQWSKVKIGFADEYVADVAGTTIIGVLVVILILVIVVARKV